MSIMSACVIIPARYSSSRFPGKPLVPLLGKPMILWVAELSSIAVGKQHVFVATDDTRIANVVESAGYTALMTSPSALTGTDRVAEASNFLNYDIFINVQGDEPLVKPSDILRCIKLKEVLPESVVNGFCWMGSTEDPCNINVPKVVFSESHNLIYMSRSPIPGSKAGNEYPIRYAKQVSIYGYSKKHLMNFIGFGRKSTLEAYEDIEILRFLDLGHDVVLFECTSGSLAVDIPQDAHKVESSLLERFQK